MKLTDFLSIPRTNVVSSALQFPAIDVEGMAKRLKLADKAKEQGTRNLPGSESQTFDAVEQSIVSEIETEGNEQFAKYLDDQKTYASRAADAALQGVQLQIGAAANDAISDFERCTRLGTGTLYALKRELLETETELNRFRDEHGLRRPATDQGATVYKVGVLVLLLALEAMLNGYFLAKGNTFGLLGGVADALLIAAINILIGFLVGRTVVPFLWYKYPLPRIGAVLAFCSYLVFVGAFNLAVAHYRNAVAGADPFEASATAYQMLVASPFGIHDLQAWALFLLGVTFSLVAMYDGLRMDDPYPGLGRKFRHNIAALDDYTATKTDLLDELDEIKKRAEELMDDKARSIESRQAESINIASRSQAVKLAMNQHFVHLETAANTLLRIYRDANSRHRTQPAPKRFEANWVYIRPNASGEVVTVDRDSLDASAKTAFAEIGARREALHNAYSKAMAEYKSIDELMQIKDGK